MFKSFFENIWQEAHERNTKNIISLLEKNQKAICIDIGCGDGKKTSSFKKRVGTNHMEGMDAIKIRLNAAKKNGINKIIYADLEKIWPLPSDSFNVVISNQVIEHILDIDNFIEEVIRILKPGGYCVISTENLSSWHNIFSLVLGYQDFSHHMIRKSHVGNPFSPHYKQKTASWSKKDNGGADDSDHPHIKIFTYISLIRAFENFGFKFEKGKGSGYYPLFGSLSSFASNLDPYHSHFIALKFRKTS